MATQAGSPASKERGKTSIEMDELSADCERLSNGKMVSDEASIEREKLSTDCEKVRNDEEMVSDQKGIASIEREKLSSDKEGVCKGKASNENEMVSIAKEKASNQKEIVNSGKEKVSNERGRASNPAEPPKPTTSEKDKESCQAVVSAIGTVLSSGLQLLNTPSSYARGARLIALALEKALGLAQDTASLPDDPATCECLQHCLNAVSLAARHRPHLLASADTESCAALLLLLRRA
eukprot:CAMPEP_0177641712 /NCGR_PEP_ID=MMETSP0447-20121125/7208_1 /TAXON_ID=0 /ORGANISM="Stygamoeba regulata, Strain BSH-02190019" /LENGTH=235 /DNA_ID=CAMNT_0019143839 /DNA_START=190 /DNA_END=893 /DNA_ORIENTATION=-